MGCQKTRCGTCSAVVKACQLINGLCLSCYTKKVQEEKTTPAPPTPTPPNSN